MDTISEAQQRERIRTEIFGSADLAAQQLANHIAELIHKNDEIGRPTVLGLATGSTPVRLYRRLIYLHREKQLSFENVVTFNLDEYYGLSQTHPESYWRFMHEQLFDHIDLPAAAIHLPNGQTPRSEAFAACRRYEELIVEAGGIDLQLLGIGRTGHIGFNEPGSTRDSRTRLVTLDQITRRDAARDFLGENNVPRHAVTIGVGTILAAREIILLAWGTAKAGVVAHAVPLSPQELAQKTQAIYQHKSQRSQTAGASGMREHWQLAEQQNRGLAHAYDDIGLANYEALEAFTLWRR